VFTKEKRSQVMAKIKSKGSKIEMKMKKALDDHSIEYKYQPKVCGKPDFIVEPKIAIFCDSSFWHGRNWRKLKLQLHEGYWQQHISGNRKRDASVNHWLKKEGYTVLRFWNKDIEKDIESCLRKISDAVEKSEKNC
jgi:DNA mismatch endonuclease (patch repair protein)